MSSEADFDLLLSYLNDELTAEAVAALAQRLQAEPELADELSLLACDEGRIVEWVQANRAAAMIGEANIPSNIPPRAETPTAAQGAANDQKRSSPLLGFLDRLPTAIQPARHPARFFGVAAALTTLFWVAVMLFVWPRGGAEQAWSPPAVQVPLPFTARIVHLEEVVWTTDAAPVRPGTLLAPANASFGSPGGMQILFGDGARAAIEGPAALRIDGRNSMTLDRGRMLAHVSPAGRGFVTQTPVVSVVDLGTEFGLEVRPTETDVQVFEGKVDVLRADDPRDRGRRLFADEAALFGISPQQGFYVQEKKMNRATYLALAVALSLPVAEVARGAVISLDFNTQHTVSPNPISPTMSGNVSGAGTTFTGQTGPWNTLLIGNDQDGDTEATSKVRTRPLSAGPLLAGDGSATNVTFTLGTAGITIYAYNSNAAGSSLSYSLRRDVFQLRASAPASPTSVAWEIAGLLPGNAYDLVLFGQLHGTSVIQGANFTVFGGSPIALDTENDGNFLNVVANANGKITGTIGRGATTAAWAGLQISGQFVASPSPQAAPIPEPASGAALGLGGMLVLGLTRRTRRGK